MRNMMDRALHYMERDPSRSYTLTELRKAAGVAIRSQYRLSEQLLASGVVVRHYAAGYSGYRIAQYLLDARERDAELERQTVAAYVAEGLGEEKP